MRNVVLLMLRSLYVDPLTSVMGDLWRRATRIAKVNEGH